MYWRNVTYVRNAMFREEFKGELLIQRREDVELRRGYFKDLLKAKDVEDKGLVTVVS